MRSITKILLKIEEDARKSFERAPFIQAFIAGIGVIIFWRGVWEFLDFEGVSPVASIIVGALLLGCVGVFIQTFIGNTIIIKNVKQEEQAEKKAIEKVGGQVVTGEITMRELAAKIDALAEKIDKK